MRRNALDTRKAIILPSFLDIGGGKRCISLFIDTCKASGVFYFGIIAMLTSNSSYPLLVTSMLADCIAHI